MRNRKSLILSKYLHIFTIIMAMTGITTLNQATAQSASDVLTKMKPEETTSYLAGVVEGLAAARWIKDKPDNIGMKCIYDWYYRGETEARFNRVRAWLERHPDKPVGTLMYVLIKKECGA